MADTRTARQSPSGGTDCCALVRKVAAYRPLSLYAAELSKNVNLWKSSSVTLSGGSPAAKRSKTGQI
jgi:hypothetical protein